LIPHGDEVNSRDGWRDGHFYASDLGGAIGFTAAKFAAHGMPMDMAQEFGPEEIHVAHVVIDSQIDSSGVREQFPTVRARRSSTPTRWP